MLLPSLELLLSLSSVSLSQSPLSLSGLILPLYSRSSIPYHFLSPKLEGAGPNGEGGGSGTPVRVEDPTEEGGILEEKDPEVPANNGEPPPPAPATPEDGPCRIDKDGDDPETDAETDDKVFPLNGLIPTPLVAVALLIGTAPGAEEREEDGYGYRCGECECEFRRKDMDDESVSGEGG